MASRTDSVSDRAPVPVSIPGGMARQYRVQYRVTADGEWRLHATLATAQHAQKCVEQLASKGYDARIVQYAIYPAAA